MFRLAGDERLLIALCLEGFLYGFYTGIFALYLRFQSKKDTNVQRSIVFYSVCALYVLSAAVFVCDIAFCICQFRNTKSSPSIIPILVMQTTLFAWCDFIAQFILIYRCWILWCQQTRIVIIPSMLAFAFLVIWIVSTRSTSEDLATFGLPYRMTLTGLALSLTVNALVTGLIVFRIFKVFWEIRDFREYDSFSPKLRCIIFVLIESAMALFSVQLARLVVNTLQTDTAIRLFNIIVVTHQMLNGITPTIILVRTSMGLSFHDERSMEETATGNLRSASNQLDSVPELGSINAVNEDSRDDGGIDVQRSEEIDVVER